MCNIGKEIRMVRVEPLMAPAPVPGQDQPELVPAISEPVEQPVGVLEPVRASHQ